ncbi:MAG: hypothetical protein JRM89_04065 [Nitrososphaerota archaeon]|nr:hypothetical protein [Nitrososphaerota archaeon]MDG6968691.1 hypothetical protein [Nitrososphaerota archaeon]MDG7015149.1 hypothetical protein [Nitrososphaerota archaeon]WGO49912.1 MAG: hypothetical protein JRM93_03470 [Nitrososphaerota archaeon]
MARLTFGSCKNCGHEVACMDGRWMHHITRSSLRGLPHWPTGHVITQGCRRGCPCQSPELDQTKAQKSKLVLLGSHTDG